MIHILLGLSSCPLQAYSSGSWALFLLAKPTFQEHISLSNNLWWENVEVSPSPFQLITRSIIALQAFFIITFKLSLTTFCHTHPGTPQISHTFTLRGSGDQKFPDLSSSASVDSDKGWQSMSPGILVLFTGPVGLMVTQPTKFNKNKVQITEKHWSRLIGKPNTSL